MSVFMMYFVQCDECAVEADAMAPRIAEVRAAAVKIGWKKVGGNDYCPDHHPGTHKETTEK